MDLPFQVDSLYDDLARYNATDNVPWSVGKLVNALLEAAREQSPDNPILGAMDPLKPGPNEVWVADTNAGAVRAQVGQLRGLVE